MIKLLIVDDEPLVCVGLQSMLDWAAYDVEVIGTARNGQQALDMIAQHHPEIVISDVKMPVKNGLELVRESAERFGRVPLFILLTSYEEFDYVREAMRLQAVDYLVKIELEEKALVQALVKAISILKTLHGQEASEKTTPRDSKVALREKFFFRLLNNLFENDAERMAQMQGLQIELGSGPFIVVSFAVEGDTPSGEEDRVFSQFSSVLQVARETLSRYFPLCHIVTLDLWYFSVLLSRQGEAFDEAYVREAVSHTLLLLRSYMSVNAFAGIGHQAEDVSALTASYQAAQHCRHQATEDIPVQTCNADETQQAGIREMQAVLPGIRRTFEEMDANAFTAQMQVLTHLLQVNGDSFLQVMDMACSVLYMALSLLPEGEAVLQEAFAAFPEGYRALHRMRSVQSVMDWLAQFQKGCESFLSGQHKSYKRQVIDSVKAYIDDNIEKRLTLQEVAGIFNFSPNYLSQLFARHTGEGFVDYITMRKVRRAKEMLRGGEGRIYEIAERLGFDNSFYFSKVFKKVEGISPREYQQRLEKNDSEGEA